MISERAPHRKLLKFKAHLILVSFHPSRCGIVRIATHRHRNCHCCWWSNCFCCFVWTTCLNFLSLNSILCISLLFFCLSQTAQSEKNKPGTIATMEKSLVASLIYKNFDNQTCIDHRLNFKVIAVRAKKVHFFSFYFQKNHIFESW